MKTIKIILLMAILPYVSVAQQYKSTESYIRFFSDAPLEDIEAVNEKGVSAFNVETGEIAFSIPIKGFQFAKSLMQEHFNENFMESDKYPRATFKGKISGYDQNKSGWQPGTANGTMNIHGVEKELKIDGELQISDGNVKIKSVFPVTVADYEIEIPKVVFYNIAEVVEVTINFEYAKN